MEITIKYKSYTLLPDEIDNYLKKMKASIQENMYEEDKIELDIACFKHNLINWISSNSKTE